MSLSEDARRFADIPFLAALEPRALEILALMSETRIMRRGETLFSPGEPAESAYLLLSGKIIVGEKDVLPGSLIGEMSLLVSTQQKSSARIAEPSAVLRIPRSVFMKILAEHPASAVRLRAYCARRLAEFTRRLDAAIQPLHAVPQP